VEIEATKTRDTREPLVVQISRRRRDFKQSYKFSDKDSQVRARDWGLVKVRVLGSMRGWLGLGTGWDPGFSRTATSRGGLDSGGRGNASDCGCENTHREPPRAWLWLR